MEMVRLDDVDHYGNRPWLKVAPGVVLVAVGVYPTEGVLGEVFGVGLVSVETEGDPGDSADMPGQNIIEPHRLSLPSET